MDLYTYASQFSVLFFVAWYRPKCDTPPVMKNNGKQKNKKNKGKHLEFLHRSVPAAVSCKLLFFLEILGISRVMS